MVIGEAAISKLLYFGMPDHADKYGSLHRSSHHIFMVFIDTATNPVQRV
jgi:hypothetical protein